MPIGCHAVRHKASLLQCRAEEPLGRSHLMSWVALSEEFEMNDPARHWRSRMYQYARVTTWNLLSILNWPAP